ncbi:MAG: S9 family peptidase [Gammaproteobacteria bacterium]|nr:S9 family peptidase [Gammaproteobacteria bacterium]
MRLFLAFTSLVFLGVSIQAAPAEELRPITHKDVWTMNRLGSPVIGPKGQLAVVSITEPSYEKDGNISDLWLISVNGDTPPRRLTTTKESEKGVAWRADGGAIAFTAKRGDDKANQVYVLSMTGPGEAVRITNLSTGCSNPVWSPNGNMIAFESRVYPGARDDEANRTEKEARDERKYNVSAYDIFPIRQWDHWRDDRQIHLFVKEVAAGAIEKDLLAGSALVEAPGFSGTSTRSGSTLKAVWTPDGKALVFNATTNLDEAAHARVLFHLYSVKLKGGEPLQLTKSTDWSCTGPKFSVDGKQIYCGYDPENEQVYNLDEIARFDWSKGGKLGAPQIITRDFDRSVGSFEISDNSRTLFITAADAGRTRIYKLPAKGGKVKALNPDSRGVYSGLQVAGKQLVAKWESSAVPAEIVRIDKNGAHKAITSFNTDRVKGVDLQPFTEFWFENGNGRQVHSWLALPPGFDKTKKYPLVLQMHGGPFSSSMDSGHVRWSAALLASPGYVVLMTDYTGSVGYGEQFSLDIGGDPLKTPVQDVLDAASVAVERFGFIDESRQAATGASYGGHMINWLQGTTTHFKALVGHAGLVSLEGQYASSDTIFNREIMNGGPSWGESAVWRNQSPSSYADKFSTPVLLTIGEKDFRVPINQTIGAWSYLQRNQVPGRLLVFHDANHWIMKGEEAKYFWEEVHTWLAKYLLD